MQHYSIKQVAELLDVADSTVRSEIRRGRLAAVRVGKVYRIGQDSLDNYMAASAYRPMPSAEQTGSNGARLLPAKLRRHFPAKNA